MTTLNSLSPRQRMLLKEIHPSIGLKHDKFGFGPPPAPEGLARGTGQYLSLLNTRRVDTSRKLRSDRLSNLQAYVKTLETICQYYEFFDDYDLREVIPTATAMGFIKDSHSDLDEGAPLRLNRTHALDKTIVDSIVSDWKREISKISSEFDLVLPNQTNLGWPFLFSAQGELRPFVLGILALAVQTAKSRGETLHDSYLRLVNSYGNPVMFQGKRLQHTGKLIPMIDANGFSWTRNLEPRVRAIYMGSKIGIIWNRLSTKKLLAAAMAQPQHTQDRTELQAKISKWMKDDRLQVLAIDVSKFDKGHGSQYLRLFSKYAASILNDPSVEKDFLTEVTMPLVAMYGRSVYQTTDKIAPQLPSGVSFTTTCGLFYGDYLCRFIGKEAGLSLDSLGSRWHYLNWGDDMIIALPRAVDKRELLATVARKVQLELTEEPVIRYLGYNYANGELKTKVGYSTGRMVLKHFLPERKKVYPFSLIGYLARLHFLPNPERFHEVTLAIGWLPEFGDPFPFSQRKARLEKAMKDSLTVDSVDSSALDFLLHGMDPTSSQELLDPLGLDFDVSDWIGGAYTDFKDPQKAMEEIDPALYQEAKTLIKRVSEDGFQSVPLFGEWITGRWSLRHQPGDVIF